ncbi:mechanosensitive ion channel family protein [Peredibacter starrii]|uniref:Mechanosensitive ion channel family protein n=1 Tax=Peredibacter starrii TaxID=28202 RepID=A0AAX4HTZ0_9BACT|nr:mechanosensitive ion channel family protein [Peredibacter starrii]WPU66451.1 mechanosensitive ion channel family protein [Peredibacter starrii]
MRNLLPNPYLLAVGISLLSFFLVLGLKVLFSTKIGRFIGRPENKWDDIVVFTVEKTTYTFMAGMAIYFGFLALPHSKKWSHYGDRAFFIILMWQVAIWSYHLLDKWLAYAIYRRTRTNPAAASSVSLIRLFSRLLLFTALFLFTLSNLGIRVTTIIAGLGVGGIAVALALQKILGDLFSSLSIVLDKPFVVGDFVVLDQYMGEVEKIGLKTTRIRSLSGEQIIISNSDLLATRIRNYKRMHERRVVFFLNLVHDLSVDRLKEAVGIITSIIHTKNRTRFERCHFMRICPTSFDIETVFWVLSEDHNLYMDIQQEIFLEILQAFSQAGIEFASPMQTIYVSENGRPFNQQEHKSVDSIIS